MIKDLFIKGCGEELFKKDFLSIYEQAVAEHEREGVFFLTEEYIRSVNDEISAYSRILDDILAEAERIRKNPSLMQYALFIHKSMQKRELYKRNISYFSLPVEEYPLFAFLCLIPAIKSTYDFLVKKLK